MARVFQYGAFGFFTVVITCAVLMLVDACSPAKGPVDEVETGTVPRAHVSSCPSACEALRASRCPEGDTPDGGDACEVVCERSIRLHLAPLPVDCVSLATSPEAVRACGVRCSNTR